MKIKILIASIFLVFSVSTSWAQPSDEALKAKVVANFKSVSNLTFRHAQSEKRWENGGWTYYWSKGYNYKVKTEYPGVFKKQYGGVQYVKNGSSYSYDRILTGGFDGYEGIPNPSREEMNAHLKNSFDPLTFYSGYLMNYLIEAPTTIELAEDPKWRWIDLNEVRCNVTATYTLKTNDIGEVQQQKGIFQIMLQRSADGITYSPDAKLLYKGKWLPVPKGSKVSSEKIKTFFLSAEELDTTKTLAQKNAVRHAEEFKKSLAIVQLPEFKSANHVLQFTHELLLEGDEAIIIAYMYQMFPRNYFQDWSDIVLNQNGERMLGKATEDLLNYSKAFCQHPVIKDIGPSYVNFYDRSKKRHNRINVAYENQRWYITDIGYTIRRDDFSAYESNGEGNCEGSVIFIDEKPVYNVGDKVQIFERGNWYDAEVLKADMSMGGYSVKYGVSGLTIWKYVNDVRSNSDAVNEEVDEFVYYENGTAVSALYTNIWYDGVIKKVSYEDEKYLVDIPARNIETWISYHDIKLPGADEKKNEDEVEGEQKKKKKKLNLKVPQIRL
ncbi:MAG: hypothetical protein GQ574_08100 [Crocinitomix sp.]|nr:hypothetical protein [Crocinitomix sp.]